MFNKFKYSKKGLKNIQAMLDKVYAERPDKDNIFCAGITDEQFVRAMIDLILGPDWYVVDPLGHSQIVECALADIVYKLTGKRC